MQFGTTGGGLGPRLQRRFATPFGAAWASFFLPGLGQAAAGDPRRGAIIAIPAIGIVGVLAGLFLFARHAILDNATNQQWLTSLMILNVVALIYHVWAMADAYMVAKRELPKEQRKSRARGGRSTGRPALKLTSMLAVLVLAAGPVLVHGAFAVEDASLQGAAACLNSLVPCWMLNNAGAIESQVPLAGNDDQNVSVAGADSPSPDSSPSSSASATAVPGASLAVPDAPAEQTTQNSSNWAADGMLNMLLIGMDAAPGRTDTLTDTMILLQVNIKTGQSAMYGIARNMFCMPLPKEIGAYFPNPPAKYACPAGRFTSPIEVNGESNAIFYDAAFIHRDWYPGFPLSACDGKSGNDLAQCKLGQDWGRGTFAVEQAVGALTGVTIDGTAIINLPGFAKVVDDLGGIDFTVPAEDHTAGTGTVYDNPCGPKGTFPGQFRVCDIRTDLPVTPGQCAYYNSAGTYKGDHCHYGYSLPDGTGAGVAKMKADAAKYGNGLESISWSSGADIAFTIKPGPQHFDGEWALAYARSRIFSTDYDRMARQQWILQAVRNDVKNPCTLLPSLLTGSLLTDINNFVWTNMPKDGSSITQLVGLASHVSGAGVQHWPLDPSTLGSPKGTTLITNAGWAQAQYIVKHGLDKAPTSSPSSGSGGGGGGGGLSC
jgi:anionic cell wall polymer biosynthesis LytR-Cps2A-Psr (LCP) family protein